MLRVSLRMIVYKLIQLICGFELKQFIKINLISFCFLFVLLKYLHDFFMENKTVKIILVAMY